MANVGRAFGFYIKYWQEMEALYRGAEKARKVALLEGLDEEERRMVKTVGQRADKQAGDLMMRCGEAIESYFKSLGNCRVKVRGQHGKKDYWYIELRLWPKGARESGRIRWTTGVSVEYDGESKSPAIYFWLWTMGGRGGAEKTARILAAEGIKRAYELVDWDAGSIAVAVMPITLNDHKNFEIEMDPLVDRTKEALKKIGKRHVEQLFRMQVN